MRSIGTIVDPRQASRFADYLVTLDISTRLEQTASEVVVWVHDEGKVAQAAKELQEFRERPDDEQYRAAEQDAKGLRKEKEREDERVRRNYVDMSARWDQNPRKLQPLTLTLLLLSLLVGVLTGIGASKGPWIGWLTVGTVVPEGNGYFSFEGGRDLQEVRQGQVWRLVTPIFVHFDLFHIFFNMTVLVTEGNLIEARRGTRRFGLLVLVMAVISNLAQYFWSGPVFGGMSGVNFGLAGYLWMKSRFDPGAGLYMAPNQVLFLAVFLVLCVLGFLGPVANTAHFSGLATGLLLGYAPHLWRRIRS